MFLKPFRIKTQSALKNSERKKMRTDVRLQYPSLSEEDAFGLIPPKDEMSVTKVSTSADEVIQIYYVQKTPVLFESYKKYYPTVYTLWKYPDLLPVFCTWPQVFGKLQNGADLMLPGVIPDKEPSPKMFGGLQKGDLVSVSLAGNRSPVALGHALLSGEDMYMTGLKGRGVGIMHIFGDTLWEAGDKSQPPTNTESETTVPGEEEGSTNDEQPDNCADGCTPNVEDLQISDSQAASPLRESEDNGTGTESEEEEERDPVAEMDNLLNFCFGCAIKSRIKDDDLPLLTVNLMRDFMQPFSPTKRLDIKKSSFKKLSRFLHIKVSESYITTKQQTKGVDVVTTIDRSHPGLKDLDVPAAVEEEKSAETATTSEEEVHKPLTFIDVYCINGVTADVFKNTRFNKGDALILSDARESVMAYIQQNQLQHKDNTKMSTLDPVLAHMILKSSEGDLDRMPLEQVINRVLGKMQSGVAITSSDGLIKIKKGKLEPIKLDVGMRASNKKMTVVENLEEYGFDLKAFAKSVQKAVACSCSVYQSEQKNKGPQVLVQGNQISFIANFLIEKCKIPQKYVVGMEKAPKLKKKK